MAAVTPSPIAVAICRYEFFRMSPTAYNPSIAVSICMFVSIWQPASTHNKLPTKLVLGKNAIHLFLPVDTFNECVEYNFYLWIRKGIVQINLCGSKLIPSVYYLYGLGIFGQESTLGYGGITSTDDNDVFASVESAIAGCTITNSLTVKFLFASYA